MVGNEAEDGVSSPSGLIVTMSTALGGIGRKKGIGGRWEMGDMKTQNTKGWGMTYDPNEKAEGT